jgi:hypothetical protein
MFLQGGILYQDERIATIVRLREHEKMTYSRLSAKFGLSKERTRQLYNAGVSRRLQQQKAKRRGSMQFDPVLTPFLLLDEYLKGKPLYQISRDFALDKKELLNIIKEEMGHHQIDGSPSPCFWNEGEGWKAPRIVDSSRGRSRLKVSYRRFKPNSKGGAK